MKFIQDDEYIIILDDPLGGKFSVDDLHALYDAGIQTIVRMPYWKDIEPEWGVYNWEKADKWVEEDRRAGLKTMLSIYDHPPAYFPNDWYLRRPDGTLYDHLDDECVIYEHIISPWSEEGWRYHLNFIAKCCERYNTSDVLCFRSTLQSGSVMLPEFGEYRSDGDLLSTVLKMMYDEQAIFVSHPSHEIWTALHPAFDSVVQTGNAYRKEIYQLIEDRFPEAHHSILTFTYFTRVNGAETTQDEAKRYPVWSGSEYAEGLNQNTDEAIALGFRGFLTGPLHFLIGGQNKVLEPWSFEAIRNSLEKWRKHV